MIYDETSVNTQGSSSRRQHQLLEFWQWAFGDLRMNDIRGVYAEWMVAKLLGLKPPRRDSWDSCDLRFGEIRIEVKAASYVQAWPQKAPSKITFTGLRGRTWDPQSGYAPEQTYNADLYVFCLEIEKNPTFWDALDLNQWRFYVLPRSVIEARNCSQISLPPLKKLTQGREINASELREEVLQVSR